MADSDSDSQLPRHCTLRDNSDVTLDVPLEDGVQSVVQQEHDGEKGKRVKGKAAQGKGGWHKGRVVKGKGQVSAGKGRGDGSMGGLHGYVAELLTPVMDIGRLKALVRKRVSVKT